ncbi:DUF6124 family protein [Pseudomonas sp. SZMC_28357]|uniref:DUF6124 family protein n=1 Tax=Pseudomonas sp. SZMC_28357 TaxID=3074380 RepID=UPI0028722408|nr:DUF6124 family protein [Pseudomonas sp. SZMC_28357]MDR9753786.1 DUF6124 family protein [Pseudomonas sp. SZMC_28357]
MFKPTPNPPETESENDSASPYENPHTKKFHEAAERALDYYLNTEGIKSSSRTPSTMFVINPDFDAETLLVHACESLASANVMAGDLAGTLEGPSRNALLGIAQIIMLGELAVNRALDRLDPPA